MVYILTTVDNFCANFGVEQMSSCLAISTLFFHSHTAALIWRYRWPSTQSAVDALLRYGSLCDWFYMEEQEKVECLLSVRPLKVYRLQSRTF